MEGRSVANDFSAPAFQANGFDDDLSQKHELGNEFSTKSESSRNPFLVQNESPKKPSKLFQKSSEMMMATKSNKYDVFKNEMVKGQEDEAAQQKVTKKAKTEVNPDLFKDFAIAAFSEFKVEKTPLIHEFSNKLSDQKSHQSCRQAKVNRPSQSPLSLTVNVRKFRKTLTCSGCKILPNLGALIRC